MFRPPSAGPVRTACNKLHAPSRKHVSSVPRSEHPADDRGWRDFGRSRSWRDARRCDQAGPQATAGGRASAAIELPTRIGWRLAADAAFPGGRRRTSLPAVGDPRPDPLLRRVRLKNYKSIAACDVELGPLTFLVGPNGSGKSNFLDALRFVAESLATSLDHAVRDRGGINEVRRRSSGHPNHFGISLDFRIPGAAGWFGFEVGARKAGAWTVTREECRLSRRGLRDSAYEVRDGVVRRFEGEESKPPAAAADRLFLVHASGLPAFRPVYDALSHMGFYNLSPDAMRDLQSPDPHEVLRRDGSNVASVLARLEAARPDLKTRLVEYLGKVVPGVTDVTHVSLGPRESIEFRQQVQGSREPWRFPASSMSDGTIRALGMLLALFQSGNGAPIPLVGIEEPETALHPAAVGVLTDSLRDASQSSQVLVTSHSPDLLDDPEVPDSAILAVVSQANETCIGPLDTAGRSALHDHLYTAGELLRMGQLAPDPERSRPRQLNLFEEP